MTKLNVRAPSPALVVSVIALVVALGGTSYAAIVLPKNSVGKKQLKRNAVTGAKVKNGSLLAADFRAGQLPAGPAGPAGAQGPQGPRGERGEPGSPDTPEQVLHKLELVDGEGSGLDADTLDGIDSAGFIGFVGIAEPGFNVGPVAGDTCADQSSFGIADLEETDFLLVQRQAAPTDGIVDSFRIGSGPAPSVIYSVCNTTAGVVDPPPAAFRILAVR